MHDAGTNVPGVAQDVERLLLLSDLGDFTYLNGFDADNPAALFRRHRCADRAMCQPSPRCRTIPPCFARNGFVTIGIWPNICKSLTDLQQPVFRWLPVLIDVALAQPVVFVHRDYMPRNLMLSTPNPGVLDFQDAVYGPITYDVASLFRDAFISWPEERELDWVIRYWERAKAAGLPVQADFATFWRDFEWMGLQRHIKVLGIFARINYRDGKPQYLKDTPRFINYASSVSTRYRELGPFAKLLDELEGRARSIGYTF